MNLKTGLTAVILAVAGLTGTGTVFAQEAVVAAADKDALFTSPDPQLNANKQVVYNIFRELLEANQWDRADLYLTERYIQHNPNAASGREGVVKFFTEVLKVEAKPVQDKIQAQVVFVTAEGDLVTVGTVIELDDPANPGQTYTTTWYDTWRIVDGKADEHWDSALKQQF
jgi:predicted SnoaL-like aldol condensation-catalyzing enzyme